MKSLELYEFPIHIGIWQGSQSVKLMTLAERMGYLNLLFCCFRNEGRIPDDDDKLAVLSELGADWEKGAGDKIRQCFYKKRGGYLGNKRVDCIIKRIQDHAEKSRQGGETSAKRRREKGLEQTGGGKGPSNQVGGKGQGALGAGGNQNPSINNNNNICLNTVNISKQLQYVTRRTREGLLVCFEVNSKRVELTEEMVRRDGEMLTVLLERFRPLNGSRKVLLDIAACAVAEAVKTKTTAVFDEVSRRAREIVADEGIQDPPAYFVAMAKQRLGYVAQG